MQNDQTKNRVPFARALIVALIVPCASALALEVSSVTGQWVGNSLLEGSRGAEKTSLSLGEPEAENAVLRVEDRSTCTLSHGAYSAQQSADGAGAWSLSFKESRGGEACERLARGKFLLRRGSVPRTLEFDATYPAHDGSENHLRGILSRYP